MTLVRWTRALRLLLVVMPAVAAEPPVGPLALDDARAVMTAAQAYARAHGAPGGAIAIVDAGGALVLAERLDGTFAAASRVSIGKAQTAAAFRKPTRVFEDAINKGRTAMAALPDFYPLQGGVPLVREGLFVGAIGVSGAASAQQDDEVAAAGAEALAAGRVSAAPAPATFLDHAEVREACVKGRPLVEDGGYKVHASRRDAPGQAEVHLRDVDIFYVLDGEATLVVGGRVVEQQTVAPDEVRGPAIEGGETRRLVKGDVMVIPSGTPHWFREVSEPLVYYVVKVTNGKGIAS